MPTTHWTGQHQCKSNCCWCCYQPVPIQTNVGLGTCKPTRNNGPSSTKANDLLLMSTAQQRLDSSLASHCYCHLSQLPSCPPSLHTARVAALPTPKPTHLPKLITLRQHRCCHHALVFADAFLGGGDVRGDGCCTDAPWACPHCVWQALEARRCQRLEAVPLVSKALALASAAACGTHGFRFNVYVFRS
jgi:hypothetical protein